MDSELVVQSVTVFIALASGLVIATLLARGKSKARNIIWGIVTMVLIAPVISVAISWVIGIGFGYFFDLDPLSSIGFIIILFPLIFFVGFGRLIIGIFKRRERRRYY